MTQPLALQYVPDQLLMDSAFVLAALKQDKAGDLLSNKKLLRNAIVSSVDQAERRAADAEHHTQMRVSRAKRAAARGATRHRDTTGPPHALGW